MLVTEWDGNKVIEYDFSGNQIWKKEGFTGRATNSRRLPNGNTFICTTNELLEVDRSGKAVYTIQVNQGLTAGYRGANGDIVCLATTASASAYDTAGKELKSFPSNRDTSWTSGIDLARNGNVLITQPSPGQKVTEYSPDGKVVKEWNAPQVTTATKLSNGNILAASHNDQKVIELDPERQASVGVQGRVPHLPCKATVAACGVAQERTSQAVQSHDRANSRRLPVATESPGRSRPPTFLAESSPFSIRRRGSPGGL